MDLKKKLGPLPVYAWGMIVGVAVLLYMRSRAASTASTSSSTAPSSSSIDPTTGLSYGAEQAAALAGTSASSGNLQSSSSGQTLADELANLGSIVSLMQQIDPNFGQMTTGAKGDTGATGAAGAPAPDPTAGTPATQAPPAAVAAANPPAATPTQPSNAAFAAAIKAELDKEILTPQGVNAAATPSVINALLGQGYKYGTGAAKGTLTKAGSSTKYFVFNLAGAQRVRQALPANQIVSAPGGTRV